MPTVRKVLGRADLAVATDTPLYTGPSAQAEVVATVSLCNRGTVDALVRLAISDGNTPAAADYLEYDATLPPKGVLERTGLVFDGTKRIVVRSSVVSVSASAFGVEKT